MIAQSARDSLTVQCGPLNKIGWRRITALFDGQEIHTDEFSPFENYRRANFAAAVDTKLRTHLSNGDCAGEVYAEIFGADDGDAAPDLVWLGNKVIASANEAEEAEAGANLPAPIGIATLIADNPRPAEPIIDGILRRGETANIIAAPKVGKSWLGYQLALSVATGRYWLDSFPCRCGSVLLIDNELHPPIIAGRLKTSSEALGIQQDEFAPQLDVLTLRGRLVDLYGICRALEAIDADRYVLVILDALYRAVPAGTSENDNAAMAMIFNQIDQAAARLNCAWVNIHHASKGTQSHKDVTDVGAGAGAQSRAADAHLVLRPHEEQGCVVLDAVVRSFKPIEPLPLRWCFPLWQPASDLDPEDLQGRKTSREERQADADAEGIEQIAGLLKTAPATRSAIRKETGISESRLVRLLGMMKAANRIGAKPVCIRGNETDEYHLSDVVD